MSTAHTLPSPNENTLQLDIPLLLPNGGKDCENCVYRLQQRLSTQNGVAMAHVENEDAQPKLCLHYDPNLVPMEKLQRVARDEGAAISQQFQHETHRVRGLDCASCAASVEHVVGRLNGVLNVAINYSTSKMKVEYDSTLISRGRILGEVKKMGYRFDEKKPAAEYSHQEHEHSHSHDAENANDFWHRYRDIALALFGGLLLAIGYFGEHYFRLRHDVALGLYAASYIVNGFDLVRHVIPTLLSRRFDVDFLMLAGAVGAAILGDYAEGAFLLFLFALGHALEHSAMESARNAIHALGNLTPKVALIRRENAEYSLPIEEVEIGDIAIIRPGDRLPVDGVIEQGHSALDQSPITGESVPVEKAPGDGVFAGSVNGEGALEVRVTKLSRDSTMARVLAMVEEAQAQKSSSQHFAEKFERIFVPTILAVVVLAAIVPPLAGWLTWKVAVFRAVSAMVGASPCALALATPAAVLAAIAQAARNGVLIKGGVHLENLGSLKAIALDKTGTITRGKPEVIEIIATENSTPRDVLQLAAQVETRSNHPLALAVLRKAQAENIAVSTQGGELTNLPGRGVQTEIEGETVRLGNARLMEENNIALPTELKTAVENWGALGHPTMIIARGAQVLGALALADTMRDNAPASLKKLRALGIESLIMLTGDNSRVAQNVAQEAGVTDFRADLLPEHKVEAMKQLLSTHGAVAMVGDGVNDAPALATSTVGIAMGAGGADVALETADVALMGDDLSKLPFAVALSRQAKNIIQQNIFIALAVIAMLVPATLFGFTKLGIAVLFHEGSTLVVCANALRLLNFKLRDQ